MSFYTDRKRAEGHGSAKSGTEHFIAQRITAVALVPLMIMFLFCVAPLIGASIEDIRAGFQNFWTSLIAAATAVFVGVHLVQGLQVVIEDYVGHKGLRVALIFALKAGTALLVMIALWALVMIALG